MRVVLARLLTDDEPPLSVALPEVPPPMGRRLRTESRPPETRAPIPLSGEPLPVLDALPGFSDFSRRKRPSNALALLAGPGFSFLSFSEDEDAEESPDP
ncbi:MAG: hypothetical protein Kow0077_32780 [Anaerolineae bacterium]